MASVTRLSILAEGYSSVHRDVQSITEGPRLLGTKAPQDLLGSPEVWLRESLRLPLSLPPFPSSSPAPPCPPPHPHTHLRGGEENHAHLSVWKGLVHKAGSDGQLWGGGGG